jgi:hypothetical protein
MIAKEIIKKFEVYVDDGTELSSEDELDLLNKVNADVYTNRPWEFSKKAGSVAVVNGVMALPADFSYVCENASYTETSTNNLIGDSVPKIIYVGEKRYNLINWSDRRQYIGKSNFCYVQMSDKKIIFTDGVSGTADFDYVFFPVTLGINDAPLFPEIYHHILYHLMATDDYMIQQFDKMRSYAGENQAKANYWLEKMQMWNANLQCN